MAEPIIHCDLCDTKLTDAKMIGEDVIVATGEKKISERRYIRRFEGTCAEHGRRTHLALEEGHATILESRLKKRFSKSEGKIILETLSPADRTNFRDALHGRYLWDDKDLDLWDACVR